MDTVKNALSKTKNFVVQHRTAVAVTATATAAAVIIYRNQKQFNQFLDSKGLTDEFYKIPES
jgi:PHD/YefM family antitoxin component YafN of YafNO toxin-antitoxin module